VHTQVVLVVRWLRHRLDLRTLAGEAGLSIATACRYLHETLDVIATHAPDLADVLTHARRGALPFLCLDGTLVPTDRVAALAERGHHLWYSGKHHAFGGSVQVLCDPSGFPLWVSDVRPGSTHDLTAARELVLPALYPHAARRLRPADPGRQGLHRRWHRRVHAGQAPPRRAAAHRQPLLQPADHPAARTRRTRPCPARPLAGSRPGHRQPAAHRRTCRRRIGADFTRPRKLGEKPSVLSSPLTGVRSCSTSRGLKAGDLPEPSAACWSSYQPCVRSPTDAVPHEPGGMSPAPKPCEVNLPPLVVLSIYSSSE
jgi:hypothetical protein